MRDECQNRQKCMPLRVINHLFLTQIATTTTLMLLGSLKRAFYTRASKSCRIKDGAR